MGKEQNPIAHARSNTILVVYPNVFAAVDHQGRLSAAVRYDPEHGKPGVVHFIGAEMRRSPRDGLVRNSMKERGFRQTMYDTTFEHSLEEQRVPHTDYIKRQVRDGSLIPANAETARLCNVKFVDPSVALNNARDKLVQEVKTLYGEDVAASWSEKWPFYRVGKGKMELVEVEDSVNEPTNESTIEEAPQPTSESTSEPVSDESEQQDR